MSQNWTTSQFLCHLTNISVTNNKSPSTLLFFSRCHSIPYK